MLCRIHDGYFLRLAHWYEDEAILTAMVSKPLPAIRITDAYIDPTAADLSFSIFHQLLDSVLKALINNRLARESSPGFLESR